jgi:hypothetical protein
MSKNAPEALPESNSWTERRRLPRKAALLRGVIAGATGENASDCMILDFNTGGAQVSGMKAALPIGTEISLLDTGSQRAYRARVMWSKADRSGLSFLETHTMGSALPPHLSFFWKLSLYAKLREIDRDLVRGTPVSLAFLNAGLSEVDLHFMSQLAHGDTQFERVLIDARRLLSSSPGQSNT